MVQIDLDEVPPFLRVGALYQSLYKEEDEKDDEGEVGREVIHDICTTPVSADAGKISIPRNCAKFDTCIGRLEDLLRMLHTLRYWGLDEAPDFLLKHFINHVEDIDSVADEFHDLEFLQFLCRSTTHGKAQKLERIAITAARRGDLSLLKVPRLQAMGALTLRVFIEACQGGHQECIDHTFQEVYARRLYRSAFYHSVHTPSGKLFLTLVKQNKFESFCELLRNIRGPSQSLTVLEVLQEALCAAAKAGAPDFMRYTINCVSEQLCAMTTLLYTVRFIPVLCDCAVEGGSVECLKLLQVVLPTPSSWSTYSIACAVASGSLACVEYLRSQGCGWDEHACVTAAAYGHLHILRYLHEQGCPWNHSAVTAAVVNIQAESLKYLLQNCCPIGKIDYASIACRVGSESCLRILHSHECAITFDAVKHAMRINNRARRTTCLGYCIEHSTITEAADLCVAAVELPSSSQRREVLSYLISRGCPLTEHACEEAAHVGDLACLALLREHGCPWDCTTCSAAAAAGQLDCLQYAHEHGCPWDQEVLRSAISSGRINCVNYILECVKF